MGFFSYDYYKSLKRPDIYLAYPNKQIISSLKEGEFSTDFIANSYDQGSIKIYKSLNGEYLKFYDDIKIGMYLLLNGVGWFVMKECDETSVLTRLYLS